MSVCNPLDWNHLGDNSNSFASWVHVSFKDIIDMKQFLDKTLTNILGEANNYHIIPVLSNSVQNISSDLKGLK